MIRVLLAEDQAMVRGALASLLGLEDDIQVVAEAGRGDEVLDAARAAAPDVALLDIGLPGLDGLEVARRIRARSGAHRPLLVAVTGLGRVEDHQRSADAGFDHHLVKPIDLAALAALLDGPRA